MALKHLVKVGRKWVNPWFVIEVDDPLHPDTPPDEGTDRLGVTLLPGKSFTVTGEDATRLRRLLGEPEAIATTAPAADEETGLPSPPGGGGPGVATNDVHPEVLTGRGPRPPIRFDAPGEAGRVAE